MNNQATLRTVNTAIGRRTLIAGVVGSALALRPSGARAQTAGVALVIGNSKYQWESPLPNVKRDVADVARSFQALGLKTELLQDLDRAAMVRALAKLRTESKGANFAALYFAGHGVVTGDSGPTFANNFVPVDVDLSNPAGIKGVLAQHTDVVPALDGAAHSLAVFDACRNNPADGWRNRHVALVAPKGLTEHSVSRRYPPNTLLLFSTAPGYTAPDGPAGQNSPFAAAFLRQLAAPPVDLLTLPGKLRRDLLLASQGRQVVFSQSNYTGSFVLPGRGTQMGPASHTPSAVVEFTNAYALARQAGLPIPAGLLGYRMPGNPDAQKVGAFKFEYNGQAALFLVLSIEGGEADTYTIFKGNDGGGVYDGRRIWRYVRAIVSGDSLSYPSDDQLFNNTFRFNDANSGTWSSLPAHRGTPVNARATRID